ncbi:MAG: hypothetical protein KAR19_20210 [Bacteroidales bacterium]|nr:hypothetical protein [Bacteroidales bacterium]
MKNMKSFMKRRDFLIGLSGLTFFNLFTFTLGRSQIDTNQKLKVEPYDMQLRPHHILDIISDHGNGVQYEPHPYGHSLHIVAPIILSDLDLKVKLVLDADDICVGCKHLLSDGKCKDVLAQLNPSPLKQAYNDVLDCRLFDYLSIEVNSVLTTRKYLELVNEKVPGIEMICTHPKTSMEERLNGLINGLNKLGIRERI